MLFPETKTFAQEPDLEDLIEYLGSNDVVLIVNAEAYLLHLFYKDDSIKTKFRWGLLTQAAHEHWTFILGFFLPRDPGEELPW